MQKCYLVTDITLNGASGTYELSFVDVPTVLDGSCFKFRIPCNITTVATAGTPLTANVSVNGSTVAVPLWDCVGNVLRTGTNLKTRTCYTAQFGADPNHLIVRDLKNA
jgi:hypothetical protein